MSKRSLIPRIVVPLLSVLIPVLVAELWLRVAARPQHKPTPRERLKVLDEAERLYPPSAPLFKTVCKDRPSLPGLPRRLSKVAGTPFREYAYPRIKPEGSYRIIGLGDSFAWGWGMFDNRRTFFKLLECWLRAKNPGRPIEVINASVPGAPASHYPDYLESEGYGFDPDMVMVTFNLNDAYVKNASVTVNRRTANQVKREKGFFIRHSRLFRFFYERVARTRVRREFIANVRDAYFDGTERAQRWQLAQSNLLAVASGCRERGIALTVIVFPLLVDLDRKYPFTREVDEIVRFCREQGIDCVNLLPTFLGRKSELLWTLPYDSHPNRVANRLAAEAIYNHLGRSGLIR